MTDGAALELVRTLYRACEAEDHDTVRTCLAGAVRWQQAATGVPASGQVLTGAGEVLRWVLIPLERDWDGFTEDVHDLRAADGHVVATGTYRGTYRASGRDVEAEFCHLWWVGGGRIRSFRQFTDTAAFVVATDS